MGFWHNVEAEREYQGMSRKELAFKAQITYASISIGLERNSVPVADAALRISRVLGVSLDYLLSGNESERKEQDSVDNGSLGMQKILEYSGTIRQLDSLPESTRESILKMISCMAEDVKSLHS